jgi:hypothetical protein
MKKAAVVVPLLLLVASVASANTYTVVLPTDSGRNTLRWAIGQANTNPGPDLINIAIPKRVSHTIKPLSQLPTLTDDATTIDGDPDDDGDPDVLIDGDVAGAVSGLRIWADHCTIRGLALGRFAQWLIALEGASDTKVAGCWLGAAPNGRAVKMGDGSIYISAGESNKIGGTTAADRNVIRPGSTSWSVGVLIKNSSHNLITGNYIGVDPTGQASYATGAKGIEVYAFNGVAQDNRIGAPGAGSGNVFGGLVDGVAINGAADTRVQGNLFGLAADGDTLLPVESNCVFIERGTTGTRVGGTVAGAGNVFAGGAIAGVSILGSKQGTPTGTIVQGNYFGCNQAGTQVRSLGDGVLLSNVGAQTIGGANPEAGNWFTPPGTPLQGGVGVYISAAGPITISNNVFGALPSAGDTNDMWGGIRVYSGGSAMIRDNAVVGAFEGVYASDATDVPQGTEVWVFDNIFRNCTRAAALWGAATGHLGDLGNAGSNDDGGNTFEPTNAWAIYNPAHKDLKAEGNDFGTTSIADIETRIYDLPDCPFAGRVDYTPLQGGIIPTGAAHAPLAVTGATATPAARGAEIVWTLSAPALVTIQVLNLAGRPVAVLAPHSAQRGLNRHTWNGLSAQGTQAPRGVYLVRLTARSQDGAQSSALATVSLR